MAFPVMPDGHSKYAEHFKFPADIPLGLPSEIGIFSGKLFQWPSAFRLHLQNTEGAKDYHAAEIGGVFLRNHVVHIDDTKKKP